ncbi:MAG TPA: hypothetical protein VII64_01140 [Thermodesulfobacteriota bacterium]
MITVRDPGEIYQAKGEIEDGTFRGRWHFSFGDYHDPDNAGASSATRTSAAGTGC